MTHPAGTDRCHCVELHPDARPCNYCLLHMMVADARQKTHCGADARRLAMKIHDAYVHLAPVFGCEVIAWDDLEDYQRALAVAVVEEVLANGDIASKVDE